MKEFFRHLAFQWLMAFGLSLSLVAQVTVLPRTVITDRFTITWSSDANTEAITSLEWAGLQNQNLTNSFFPALCIGAENVQDEYFGNSWAPPDPQSGGFVLVGGGTTEQSWLGKTLGRFAAKVTVHSDSTGCPPSSAGVPVKTQYRFLDSPKSEEGSDVFLVRRSFDFETTAFAHNFRPYIPRLALNLGFTEVIYPTANGGLTTVNVLDCPLGCTGPIVPEGSNASPLGESLDPKRNWFVIHDPVNGTGLVVSRARSSGENDKPIAAQLWVDNDAGSNTNASSFLLLSPSGGFRDRVTEKESLCFFVNITWSAATQTLPPGCQNQHKHDGNEDEH